MIELKINAVDAADLRKQLSEILGTATIEVSVPFVSGDSPKPEPAKRGRPAKEQSVVATTVVEQSKTEAGPATAEVEVGTSDDVIAYDTHVKPAILEISKHPAEKGGGREGVLKLLEAFEVDHASKLTPDQWPALLAKVEADHPGLLANINSSTGGE